MNHGMLYFDDSSNPFEAKLGAAARYYESKLGHFPTSCHVHPGDAEPGMVGAIKVEDDQLVMPSHLWIGEEKG